MEWFRGVQPSNFVQIPLKSKGKLFVSPMPFGPYDPYNDIFKDYLGAKINQVLILVTDYEIKNKNKKKMDLISFYEKSGISPIRLPFADLSAPPFEELKNVIPDIVNKLDEGINVAIHCNAGVGRTAVMAACICSQILSLPGDEAITYVNNEMMINLIDSQKRIINRWAKEIVGV